MNIIYERNGGVEMFLGLEKSCGDWMEFLYYCRAKFALFAACGIRLSFFSNLIANTKAKKHLCIG
ncbi:RAxF-45 family protein [Oceanobacillus oncorhynchi]|nr:RAxF-45 family protein [Oceanobacillus oncorhynchi]